MKIIIYQNREVYKEESKIGNDSENKVETLEFEFPAEYENFTKYIEFQIKGGKYVDLIDNNKYVITREVAKYGKIKTQIVLKKNTENDVMVFKSDIFTLNVSNSINATENLVNTVGVDLIEKIVTKNNEQDTRLDILEADNATNKENISSIQDRQVTQDNRIDDLEADNTSNKSRITDIETKNVEQDNKIVSLESKNAEQDTNIQKNTDDIKTINEKNKSQDTEITNIKLEQATQNTNIQKNTDDIAKINAKNTAQDKEIEEINKKDTTQDNLIEELQTENTKLKKTIESMQIPGEEVGNPIHLSDSSDMECEIVPIGGAEQETRSGNLYNSSTNVSGYISSTGDITSNNNWIVTDYISVIALINYYTAGNTNLTAGEGVYGAYYNSNKELISTFPYSNYKTETATIAIPENAAYIRFSLYKYADNTATFDFYTDAPSPNYPSKVVTVGQNVNIFDKDNANKINAWIDNSGYFQYSSAFKILYIQCDKNKDYVVSSKYLRGIAFLNEVPKTGLTSTNFKIQNATELTLNSQDNTYLAVWYYATASGLTEEEILDSIKIVEGTKATAWSPYGQGSVEIEVCNENFFNFDKLTVTGREESEVTFDKELGKIEATASTSDKYLLKSFTMKGLTVGETYTIGFKHKTKNCTFGGNGIFRLSSTASFNSYDYGYVNGSTSETYSSKTFVAITDALTLSFLGVNGTAPSDTCTMYAKDIMLVKGATAKNYIPHESYTKVLPIQKEFVKIGDVEDTFVKVEGKWYEKHDIPKYIFTGNESFSRGSTRNGFYYFETTISDLAGKYAETNRILCNVAKEISSSDMYEVTSQKDLIGTNSKNVRLMLSNINTVAELQAYLSEQYANETPATLYYLSTTPQLIPCTEEQESILNSFYTYKGVTNISVDGIGTLKVNYKKDLETIINNINSALLS